MQEIILTGYDKKTFDNLIRTKTQGGCYFCKRNTIGVYLIPDENNPDARIEELYFSWYTVVKNKLVFKYLLCDECFEFFKDLVGKLMLCKEVKEDFDLEWGSRKQGGEDE